MATTFFESSNHVRCCAGSGDADNGILIVDAEFLKVEPALAGVVFGVLHGVAQGGVAACNDADYPRWLHAECGRNFRGIEHTEAAGCAGTHIEYAAAAFHARNYLFYKALHGGKCFLYGECHFLVFVVDVADYFAHRFLFEVVV